MPVDPIAGWGYPEVTDSLMRNILERNYVRLHNLDGVAIRERIADDEFSIRRTA